MTRERGHFWRHPPFWFSGLICAVLIAATGQLRLGYLASNRDVPLAFSVQLLACLWFRDRRLLWLMVFSFAVIIVAYYGHVAFDYRHPQDFTASPGPAGWLPVGLRVADIVLIGLIMHIFIGFQKSLELRNAQLKHTNEVLAAHEREIARQNQELRVQAGELEHRRREAEEAAERKARFLAAVSHDIRTPANAINLLAELISRSAADPQSAHDIPETARELQASASSLVDLVSDVMDITRYDSGRVELQLSDFSLAELLREEHKKLYPLADAKKLSLEVESDPLALRLRADRVKLGRIVSNLIGNAIKYTEHGSVKIGAARRSDGAVRIHVSDSGVGIAREHQGRIFDEFYQIKNPERDRAKGTGLGLSICKRLVTAMGGRLEVQSVLGLGSTFAVVLPRSCDVSEGKPVGQPDGSAP